jgi:hypothetical protein
MANIPSQLPARTGRIADGALSLENGQDFSHPDVDRGPSQSQNDDVSARRVLYERGQSAPTTTASVFSAEAVPVTLGFQPRVMPMATVVVIAATVCTAEARNTAATKSNVCKYALSRLGLLTSNSQQRC